MAFWETQVNSALGTSVGTLLAIKPKRTFASFSGFVSITESHSTAPARRAPVALLAVAAVRSAAAGTVHPVSCTGCTGMGGGSAVRACHSDGGT